jgi:hypothetical protein
MTTSDDAAAILRAAAAAVETADLPEDLRQAGFEKAVDLVAGRAAPAAHGAGGSGSGAGSAADTTGAGDTGTPAVEGEGPLPQIANKLGLSMEIVGDVFDVEDGALKIVLPTSSLESGKKAATRQLALLIAVARQAAGLEEWTYAKDIREVTKEFNKFDVSNFAQTLNSMDEVFRFTGNGAAERRVKVTRQGYEQAAGLVRQLGGGDA